MNTKVVLLYFSIILVAESWAQLVNTPDGPVQGTIKTTNSGRTYYAYYTIPYAKPPIGSKRFLASEPIDPWTDVYNATTEKLHICYQTTLPIIEGETEDCLNINVFTLQNPTEPSRKLPVMVNIHGGAFYVGSGLESFVGYTGGISPKYYLEYDVIYVSFNYRLGIFGFLSTGDDIIPGNAGLKDQILALKWIQKNIASFGGDPSRVTVVGQSAGAASIGYLLLSPAASGLFSAAIMESGTALLPCVYQRHHKDIAFKTGAFIDSKFNSSRNSKDLLEVMQNASAEDIDLAALSYTNWDTTQPGWAGRLMIQQGIYFAPVIEALNPDPVLTENQYETLAKGNINNVPILIGICSEEGLINVNQNLDRTLEEYDTDSSYLTPQNLHINDESIKQKVGGLIKDNFCPNSSFKNFPLGGIRYFSEHDFIKSSVKHAELQSNITDVYFYQFAYTGIMGGNTARTFPGSLNVTHTEEMMYMFLGRPIDNFPADDQLIHNRLMRIWTNFAIYNNPTPIQDELLQNITWPKVKPDRFQHVNIGNFTVTDLQIIEGKPRATEMVFWDNIYDTYGTRPFDTY